MYRADSKTVYRTHRALSAMLHQPLSQHGRDRPVKCFEALVNIICGMHAGEDATAARHQVDTAYLQGLAKAVLDWRRDVLQRRGIHPDNRAGAKVDVKRRRFTINTGSNFLSIDDLTQALAQALGHTIGLGLHLTRRHDAQG